MQWTSCGPPVVDKGTAEAQAVVAEPQADGAGLEEDLPQVECPLISGPLAVDSVEHHSDQCARGRGKARDTSGF